MTVYTIGHSTKPFDEFLGILKKFKIKTLADIRHFPSSKKFPWFAKENLESVLPKKKINYKWIEKLGGFRRGGYEEYMKSDEWNEGFQELIRIAKKSRTAIMCAEWSCLRCHRIYVADELHKAGFGVVHIINKDRTQTHEEVVEKSWKIKCNR